MIDLRALARALGGEVVGRQVLVPGPGHSRLDRSLAVRPSVRGFLFHSFAGDPWDLCADYVRARLGLPRDAWKDERPLRPRALGAAASISDNGCDRGAAALQLAARQLGLKPCWALGSAGGLKASGEAYGGIAAFPVIAGVEALTILRERDEANARAAAAVTERWHAAGREVLYAWPNVGKDINAAITGGGA
jgi:hypothetical protein